MLLSSNSRWRPLVAGSRKDRCDDDEVDGNVMVEVIYFMLLKGWLRAVVSTRARKLPGRNKVGRLEGKGESTEWK